MITYICDSCGQVILEPFKVGMKEFCYCRSDRFVLSPCKRKTKVHLCENCFKGLNKIASVNIKNCD